MLSKEPDCALRTGLDDLARSEVLCDVLRGQPDGALAKISKTFSASVTSTPRIMFQIHQLAVLEHVRTGKHSMALQRVYESLRPLADANTELRPDLETTMQALILSQSVLDECSEIGGSTPADVRRLMSLAQRGIVADAVNQAILESQGRIAATRLPLLLRMLQWAQARVREEGVKVRELRAADVCRGGMGVGDADESDSVAAEEVLVMQAIADCCAYQVSS